MGFPKNYNQLLLHELVRSYPGLRDYQLDTDSQTALVTFQSHDDAEVALAGIHIEAFCMNLFLFRAP